MIKEYYIKGLDCANCAAKLENRLKHIDCLQSVNINFFNRKLIIKVDEEDLEKAYQQILKITKKVEPNVTYSEKEDEHEHHSCECGHEHHKHTHHK